MIPEKVSAVSAVPSEINEHAYLGIPEMRG